MRTIFLFLFFVSTQLSAQIVGKVTDTNGESLAYVNVYIKNSYVGTTTNDDGNYNLNLSEPKAYEISFQYLGYKTVTEKVHPKSFPFILNVQMQEESTSLSEVIISKKEDPAYRIIRKTIDNRKNNLERFDAYTADFYSRGLWRVKDVPEKILGQEVGDLDGAIDSTRAGIVYLSETISKISYEKPDKFKERILASKVSGNDNGFSFNNALSANLSFYENTIPFNVPLVSPIATNALNYYKYKLEGVFYEGTKLVNKIAVIPRRANDNVWEGVIYIVEDDWQLYGVELKTTGAAIQVPFVEELVIKQTFKLDNEYDFWVRISQTIDFQFKFMMIKGQGRFIAMYSNYNFNPQFDKKSFSNELLSFEDKANKKDSTYWNGIRPVPLTDEEIHDYIRRDSIQQLRTSKVYLDSIDAKHNKFQWSDPIFGYTYTNSYEKWSMGYESPALKLGFNTVQGFHGKPALFFRKSYDENRADYVLTRIKADYGLAEDRLRWEGEIIRNFNLKDRLRLSLTGGSRVQQFNRQEPIKAMINSMSSLWFERNYMKVFELNYAQAGYSQEVLNGLHLSATLAYENRKPLFNNTEQVYIRNKGASYTSNNPRAPEDFVTPAFEEHSVIRTNVQARIVFNQKYFSNPDMKMNLGNSKYPVLTLNIQNGIGLDKKQHDYTLFQARINQGLQAGNKGTFKYNLKAGTFMAGDGITFADYKHFNGNQTRIGTDSDYLNVFNLLPYYEFSTNKPYFEGHLEHDFKGWVLGKIPGLNLLNWNMIVGAHFLSTEEHKPYSELSVGLDNVGFGNLRLLRIDYVHSFFGNTNKGAFIFGLKFLQILD
ncbi:MAG TPA: DUF5686 and carboxypeptidase regulatory-like domain-containing protein [Flavobacteriaceae bacterium]|nr:DUF5686 and carboxypeptidase regulatory-like domain-containing protein [Flavobacteriaceae bacterium]